MTTLTAIPDDSASDPTIAHLVEAIQSLTPAQVSALKHALTTAAPSPSTRLRQQTSGPHVFPVIARSGRTYKDSDGRLFGETPAEHQRQADARFWRVGKSVRAQCLPMTVSVGGLVVRIWEVLGWTKDPDTDKWVATLGRLLTNDELDAEYPDYPYRYGDSCPTRQGSAYRPESY